MGYCEWISHNGKEILHAKTAGLGEKEYLDAVDELESMILPKPEGSTILLLLDVTDSKMTPETRDRGQQMGEKTKEKGLTTISALVGITGIQKIIASAIKRGMHYANSIEDAKDWLASQ